MKPRLSLLCLLVAASLSWSQGAAFARPSRNARLGEAAPKAVIFRSRQAVARRLGRFIADQLPAALDFSLYALVWVERPRDERPRVQIITPPADQDWFIVQSPVGLMRLRRSTRELHVVLTIDSAPCSGGIEKPPEVMEACRQRVAAERAKERATLTLIATPRAHLRRTLVERQPVPPRP